MGLDACVYCDCFEKGRLKTPPPNAELVYVDRNGSPELLSGDSQTEDDFDDWRYSNPCSHEQFWLVSHRLGNMSGIGDLRHLVSRISAQPERDFALLWTQVIYSGTHAGDFLTPEEAVQLGAELQLLREVDISPYVAEHGVYWGQFLEMMEELVEASRLVNKPIAF